jgi:galactonate dehydratase
LDRDAVQRLWVDKPSQRYDPPRLVETSWPDGRRMYFANTGYNFMLREANRETIPFYERGVNTRLLRNDGSNEWKSLYQKALNGPFVIKG